MRSVSQRPCPAHQERRVKDGWTGTHWKQSEKKHRLIRKWQMNRNEENYKAYIKARNQAKAACRKAQRTQEAKVAVDTKSNPEAFWKYVKAKTKSRTGVADLEKEDRT